MENKKNELKKIKKIKVSTNYTLLSVGKFSEINKYVHFHKKLKTDIHGKVFIGKDLESSGAEISFQYMLPETEIPFYHKHRMNEEIYIFLKGKGQFQVDNEIFEIEEGSILKVLPEGKRTWRNNSKSSLIFMVIQTRSNSLENFTTNDGYGIRERVEW